MNDTSVKPWTKLDTRRLTASQRRSNGDELAHVRAPAFLIEGVARATRVGGTAALVHLRGMVDPARLAARLPASIRSSIMRSRHRRLRRRALPGRLLARREGPCPPGPRELPERLERADRRDCDLLRLRLARNARAAPGVARSGHLAVRARGERRREHALVGGCGELEVSDRDRRPAEHVEGPQKRRELEPDLELVAVVRRQRPRDRRGDVEVDRRPVGAPARDRLARRPASSGVTAWAASSFVRTFSPYSEARLGKVARCASAASQLKSGQVSAGGSGISASTTRAPSASSRSTYCSAAGLGGCAGPPTDGGRVSSPTVSPASSGAGTGACARTDHTSAASATVRASGPTVSKVGTSGKTPSTGIRPHEGFMPTRPQQAAGSRIEQPVSVPRPMSQSPAAIAAALPPDEPPAVAPGSAGLPTVPYHGFWLVTPQANSCRFALPTSCAPAASSRAAAGAVRSGT